MSWEVGLFLIAVVGWYGLHPWLAKAGYRAALYVLISLEILSFCILGFYVSTEIENYPTSGMPGAMFIVGGIALLIGPAVLGLIALLKFRRASVAD